MNPEIEKEEINLFKKHVNEMEKIMDLDVNPCEDFIKFACGNYDRDESDNFIFDQSEDEYYFSAFIPKADINYPSFVKAQQFYKSCKNQENFMEFLKCAKLLDCLPIYNKNWTNKNFDLIKVSGVLSSIGIQTIFEHSINFSEENITMGIKYKVPYAYDENDENNQNDLEILKVCKEDIPRLVSNITAIVEKPLPTLGIEQETSEIDVETQMEETILQLGELKGTMFDYNRYFEIYFGKSMPQDISCVLVNSPILNGFLEILLTEDPKVVADFIFWQAAVQFLYTKYYETLTKFYFEPTIIASGFSKYFNENDKRKYFESLNLCRTTLEKISSDFYTPSHLMESVEKEEKHHNEIFDFVKLHFDQERIEKDYENAKINENNFYENIINLQKCFPTKAQKICLSSRISRRGIYYLYSDLIRRHNKPLLCYFSGVILQILKTCVERYKFDSVTQDKIKETLIKQKSYYDRETINSDVTDIRSGFYYAIASEEALKMYKKWLENNETQAKIQEDTLKGLNLNNFQAFFVGVVQYCCSLLDKCEEDEIFLGLINSDEFSKEFQCKPDSPMNPKLKYYM